jgi:septal ring-binding cell division protein DamX
VTNLTTSNNLDVNPSFADEVAEDFSLAPSSSVIDAGDNTLVPAELTKDLAGNNRIENGTVDVGVYEFSGSSADVTDPTVITQDITVQLDANGNASVLPSDIDNGSTDDVTSQNNLILSLDTSSFDCSNIGTNAVNLTVEDEAGNTASETATVTVEDVTAPDIITQNISVDLAGNSTISIVPNDLIQSISDNCGSGSDITLNLDQNTFTAIGTYTVNVTATDPNGNQSAETATVIVDDTLGVDNREINFEVKIYPNPASYFINIESNTVDIKNIQVYDINGRLLKTSKKTKFNVADLSSGMYILQIQSTDNQSKIEKFIKK